MKKQLYTILLLLVFIVFPKYIYADCTKEELKSFREIKDEFKIELSFDTARKIYYPNFFNPEPENYGYVLEYKNGKEITTYDFSDNDEEAFFYTELAPGKYKVRIMGKSPTCSDTLKSETLNIPKYNTYSEDPLCEGIEEFVLCQKSYNREIDYDTFVSRVETYKKTKSQEQTIIVRNEKTGFALFIENVKNYILENLVTIIIVAVFVVLLVITIILTAKQMRKSRRLE